MLRGFATVFVGSNSKYVAVPLSWCFERDADTRATSDDVIANEQYYELSCFVRDRLCR